MYCRVGESMGAEPKHPQAKRYPSAVVPLALLYALNGVGERGFYRWLTRDAAALVPALPERTRRCRLFAARRAWAGRSLAEPTVLGSAGSHGAELRHPRRHGRAGTQRGKEGWPTRRWIAGGTLCVLVNRWGRGGAWDAATANVRASASHPLLARFDGQTVGLADGNVHRKAGAPADMEVRTRGTWPQRLLVETVLALLTRVCHRERAGQRLWGAWQAPRACAVAVFHLLADWAGLPVGQHGRPHRAIAAFSL